MPRSWWSAFLHGMSFITLWPAPRPVRTPYTDRDPAQADAEAIASDWRAVGNDLRVAMRKLTAEEYAHLARVSGAERAKPQLKEVKDAD